MNKFTKKGLCFVLAIVVGFGIISPNFSVSADELPPEEVISLAGLFKDLEDMATGFAVTEAYARTATVNTKIVFDKIKKISLNVGLVQPLETHLNDINTASKKWLDDIKPKMQQVNQNIISWTNTQTAFITPLRNALQNNDKDTFVLGLGLLQNEAESYQKDIDGLVATLISYRGTLEDIVGKLSADFNKIKKEVEGKDGSLAVFRSEIETLNLELKAINQQLTGLAFGAAGGITMGIVGAVISTAFPIAGGVMMLTGVITVGALSITMIVLSEKREDVLRKIANKTREINQTKFEYGVLSHINDDTAILRDNTKLAFDASENMKSQWTVMGTKIKNIIRKLNLDWDKNKVFLPAQLNSLEKEGAQLNKFAQGLQLEYQFKIEDLNKKTEG
ncbi:HBL/NHE enterotoxin family protein [Chengkuizengella sediminis]|uniref:HBL/NHE enterotoxin family protein n=1 Tax=Chengkuizengella sediminis TaxID=1885917 RepID=UPI00138A3FCE|nr:HBL/NHE enterotoxin family protein [Chengkuizengella sediminis]NDI33208.1 alpha-helical pore-forming toxin family protein [Chengkuizengella sediminis]